MYKIRKEFNFSAGHHLEGLPKGHPCGREHGHNYIVTVELITIELDSTGFVQDYGELKPIKEWIDTHLDQVADVFYVSEIDGTKLIDRNRQQEVREALLAVLH